MEKTYAELKLAHARYRDLVYSIPGATAIYMGPDMEIVMANKAMVDFWGKENVIGKPLIEAVPELKGQPFPGLLKKVYETGIAYQTNEAKADLVVGGILQTFYFNFNYSPLRDVNGNVEGIIHSASDVTELVVARQRAADAENRLHFTLQSADIGTWDLDPINQSVNWDERCKELFGYNRNEPIFYHDVLKYIHPEDVENVEESVAKVLNPSMEGKLDIHFRTIGNEGHQIRWLHCKGQAYFNPDNIPYRFTGIARDITAEFKSHQEQEKLLWMIDNTNDFISLSDWDGQVTYLNRAGQQMMGFEDLNEVRKKNKEYLIHEDLLKITEINNYLIEHGKWNGLLHFKHQKTGESIPGYASVLLLLDQLSGLPIGQASVVRDLRTEQEAKAALLRSERKFEFVTDFMPQQVWTANPDGLLDFVNQQTRDYFGKTSEELINDNWQMAVHPDDLVKTRQDWGNALKSGKHYQTEFRLQVKDGSWRWHLSRAIPFHENDKIIKWFGTNTDIEDQKRNLAKKDEFISIASHELKTPMTSLKASLQFVTRLFNEDSSSDKIRPLLGKANDSLKKLSMLIEDLLNVSKLEAGQLILNKSTFRIRGLIEESCEHLIIAKTHEITITGDPLLEVYADIQRLDQVLINLVNNAVKYAPESNRINLRIEQIKGFIKVSVQDYGIGIPPEKLRRIFDRYYRVDLSGNQISGLGLGLYISAEIIRRHGGEINIESELGKGSTFWFTIPAEV